MNPLFIDKDQVATSLPMNDCITVMENAFRSLAQGKSSQPLRSLMWLPDHSGLLGMMPGIAVSLGIMGIKVISVFHGNQQKGLPSHQGMVLLFDGTNGKLLMSFDASEITAIRTAATSALATRLLARPDSKVLAVIGTGEQAARHIEAILLVRKIGQINVWGRNEQRTRKFVESTCQKYKLPVESMSSAEAAVKGADIICTVTAAKEPVILGAWIAPGTHINAVGACTPAARELDTAAVLKASLFTDSRESLLHEAGDFLIPKIEGNISDDSILGELGEVLMGAKPGRRHGQEITIFKSLGIAVQDIYSAWYIYEKLKRLDSAT